MANALGRISGQLLKNNLTRNGQPLSFHAALSESDEPVLKLNVTNRYISVNSDTTLRDLFVNNTIRTTNLISLNRLNDPLDVSPLKLSISGNTIVSRDNLNLLAATQVNANIIDTDNIRIDGNVISTKTLNTTLDFTPAGSLDIYNELNVTGNLRAWDSGPGTGNITLGGNITFGSTDQSGTNADTISFAADINTDINPNLNATYRLGTDTPSLSFPNGKRWESLYSELINGEQVTSNSVASSGVNLTLLQGKIWYVATNGSDIANPELTQGKHQNAPFASISQALGQATSGDTVYIYPGTYTEIFPLTIPVGVTVKGTGIRSVTVQPTVGTQSNNAFLLNGESTVSDLTVKDFYAPGYAFSFAPGFTVSSRSPYVQNITVITKGSVTLPTDPRGFDQGDAGGGARVDGSLATASSKEASMLFHSVTFITPGVDALVMTNGVRVEWLNSFTYFANRGLYATNGILGFASLGIRFGAELRSIGSANVYGNYGAEANGASTLMYLIQHNFAYIGAGKDVTNDPSLNIAANETVEIAAGKIYYQSLDNKGNFKVGDAFGVSFDTGLVTIGGVSVSAGGVSSINFLNGTDETVIDAEQVTTGNIRFSDNLLTTLSGALNLDSGTDEIKLNANTDVADNLDIVGNFNIDGTLTIGNAYIDVVRFEAPVEFDLRPKTDDDFTLGGPINKRWDFVYLDTSYIGNYKLENATISTVAGSADVELRADGTGRIFVNQDNVEFDQDLTVSGITELKTTNITGTITQYGDYLQTGSTLQTGNRSISLTLDVDSNAYFDSMSFVNNTIATTDADTDLQLKAALTGIVNINDNVTIDQNLRINSTTYTNGITNSGITESDTFSDNDIEISLNNIKTTVGSNDLRLLAAGTGIISVPNDSAEFNQNLTVNGTTNLKNTVIGSGALASSLSFSSSNYLSLSSAQTIGTQAYTFECFFYTASNGLQTILGATASGGMSIWLLGDGINPVTIIQIDRSNIDAAQYTVSPITTNTWHHLAVTRDSLNNVSVFLDGVKATGSVSNATNYTASSGLIGAVAGSSYFFTGYLTQIKLAVGSNYYDPIAASISVPTAVLTTSPNTKLLLIVANSAAYLTDTSGIQTVSNISSVAYASTGPSTSNITHIGNYLQTGNTVQTGNRTITGTLDVTNNIYFDNINIVDNRIFTTNANDDLELRAVGLGIVVFNDNTQFSQAALFGTLVTNGLTNSGTITSDIFTNGDIEINDNYITTTVGNNDLRLVPNGTGKVSLPLDPVAITQKLTVEDDSILKNVAINGDLDHLGNTTQTGNVVQTGNFDLSTDLTVTGTDAFFTDVRIINNSIATSTGSNNLELRANGTGIIKITDSATFGQTLTVNGITTTSTLSTVTGTITSDIFSDGDIEINDNYITTTVGNNNLILAGNTTGGPKLEQIKFNASTISTETTNQGFTLTVPTGGVIINAATALKVPVGTTVNRPTLTQGEFRFNSTDNLFRGYSTSTVSFAGVYSADRRTSVLAHPTNNTLLFTTNTLNNMTVSATGLTVNSFTVDNNITFATNIISTAVTNNDLFLTPNGLGKVVIDDISLLNNEIINSSNTALVLQNTGSGYVKFGGTGGIALPAGPTVGDTSGIELGDLRYNTDLSIPEIFNGVAYVGFVSESAALLTAAEVQEITNLWALVIG